MKIEKKVDAVWLAAAILTFEKYNSMQYPSIDELYFKQSEIINLASRIYGDPVPNTMASSQCVSNSNGSVYNYLVGGDGILKKSRRISYVSEFNGHNERPQISPDILVETSQGHKTVGEIFDFVNNSYSIMFLQSERNQLLPSMNCKSILEYLWEYADKPYTSPEKSKEEEKDALNRMSKAGRSAVNELDKMASICEIDFGLKKNGVSKWLDGSNKKARNYLWRQMKLPGFEECPTSISLFAESVLNNQVRFRFSVELNEVKSQEKDFENHHKVLSKPIENGSNLFYLIGGHSSQELLQLLDEDNVEVSSKIKNGTYKKIQISSVLPLEEINGNNYGNEKILETMRTAIEKLMPYYKLVLKAYDPEVLIEGKGDIVEGKGMIFDNNIILYGPPGTGKTYNTVNYAVSIVEKKSLSEIKQEDYQEVFKRYKAYKEKGQIGFITFHQSYGYEEFIEGIKPILDEDINEGITYKIESGVFKEFCENAQQLKLTTNNEELEGDKNVWKISLGGSGMNWLKEECFAHNQIRIGWDSLGLKFLEEEEYPSDTLYYFYEEMSIGDIVFSLADQKHIDAIGIITGDPIWLETEDDYKRSREVKWIATDIYENIYELNGKKNLVQQTIYKLSRLSINDVNNLILKYSQNDDEVDVKVNSNNYVFIIDEINRGNISKIFGELITLIEPTKRIGAEEESRVKLPYSKKEFGVPKNVYLLGTMNTADRSIALLDTALRRRFNFIEMMPDVDVLEGINVGSINIKEMVETMNRRIELLYDREHTIGHAYFLSLKDSPTIEKLAGIFLNAIIPLLQEYFYEDYSKIQLVLGDNAKADDYKFILDEKIKMNAVFKGRPDIDLPEQKYQIQTTVFSKEDSYKGIYEYVGI